MLQSKTLDFVLEFMKKLLVSGNFTNFECLSKEKNVIRHYNILLTH